MARFCWRRSRWEAISHGDPDLTIPTHEGSALFAAANEPKNLLIFPGAGHNVFGSAGPAYLDQLDEFLRGCNAGATAYYGITVNFAVGEVVWPET